MPKKTFVVGHKNQDTDSVVDIIHSQPETLVFDMEKQVAEALGERLASPHSIIMGGVMSRKKQVVPS